jgi:hypothetical protein
MTVPVTVFSVPDVGVRMPASSHDVCSEYTYGRSMALSTLF